MQTDRLYIRHFTLDDAESYLPLVSNLDVLRYTDEEPQTSIDSAREILLAKPLRDYYVRGFGRMACIEKSSGRLIGFSGLKFLEDLQEVDVGYRFLPDCWGKGYATESAQALIRLGVHEHGISRIIGLVRPENTASANVLKKLGLAFDRSVRLDDCSSDLDLYATPGTGPNNSFKPKPLRGSA